MNRLYAYLRLYANFFQPVMKMTEKKRIGSKVQKKHDDIKTPYQRLLESSYPNLQHFTPKILQFGLS
ncbi:hypothetical protein [Thermospira aquatica]|uniref:Uncharacterized protein n=1 Tax=Thermospira aquatica TaxID=2828656 RepID=A0AAX3BC36_9SPIR|nr:hypothetical protein [Thermospira aquatica]URA09675.1 hypothetical protein KDW03_09320 [Thermospira aquatica]